MTTEPELTARREVADGMAEAARAWLTCLDSEQRAVARGSVPMDADSDTERRRWFYTPTDHGGLTLNQQRPAQQRAAMRLVASGLSAAGYVTVALTMGLENVLDYTEGFVADFDRDRGRDPGMYYLRVFGEPGESRPWAWRFGGHHVSLNYLIADGLLASATPCFMGADPASSPLLGELVHRPLGRAEDLARELVGSLPEELAARAVLLPKAPPDLVTANRSSVSEGDRVIPLTGIWRGRRFLDPAEQERIQDLSDDIDTAAGFDESDHRAVEFTASPKGLPATELDNSQRALLRALLGTYFGRVPDGVSPMGRYHGTVLDAVHVAWAGSLDPGQPHYYRIQGPHLLIEWDNTQRDANHAHSVWRDPSRDFGLDVLTLHHRLHH
jgi:Protein of unknown function (DUF3500)